MGIYKTEDRFEEMGSKWPPAPETKGPPPPPPLWVWILVAAAWLGVMTILANGALP